MWDDGKQPTGHGAAFLAIDVNAIAPAEEFLGRMERLVDEIHAAPRAEGVERLLVPGELEWERHARAEAEGIVLPADVVESLDKAANMAEIPLPHFTP